MKKSCRYTAMLLMLVMLSTQAAFAQTTDAQGGSPVPGVSREAFGEALMEDQLQMVPVSWTARVNSEEKALPLSLSPDGNYLLLGVIVGKEPRLYLYDIRKGVCGQVAIALDNPMKEAAFADGATKLKLPGMIWAENNRLLLFDGEMCRLFELGIAQ